MGSIQFWKSSACPTTTGVKLCTATRTSSARPVETGRMLSVDLNTAMVRDDETGLYIRSAGLGALASKLIELLSRLPC
jgi:hypothetical protein